MTVVNRRITLAARPVGYPEVSDFHLGYAPVPAPQEGEVVVRTIYLSIDPCLRGRMNHADAEASPISIGEVLPGRAVGRVEESRDPGLETGDAVEGILGWQEYAVVAGAALRKTNHAPSAISTALGVLGAPGLTAYFGLLEICDPRPDETVVVSAAAGGIGMIAGQLAKLRGCRVIGVAGSEAKTNWLCDELGFAAAINYKPAASFPDRLRELCPDGVDVYFDNVGGAVTDAVVARINPGARIALCGQISQDNLVEPELGPRWLAHLVAREARLQGFLTSAYSARFSEGFDRLGDWFDHGQLVYREDVAQGIEAAPQAFIGVMRGDNQGKQLVQVSPS
jgi:NADPH-dependent curcumin reductase CurA